MSITILTKPYDGLGTLPKLNPVYNGLGFTVQSTMKQVANFKYIADVFINGGKVAQLAHNPDISNNNIGIFDVGRIVENYISYNLNWNITTPTAAYNSLLGYHIEFGEEYSRIVNVRKVDPSYGIVRVETTTPHNLKTGDRVLVQGSLIPEYNGFKEVTYNSITSFKLNTPFTWYGVGGSMYIISGEKINQFQSYVGADGRSYVRLKVKANSSFSIGNIININLDAGFTSWIANYQNMDWTVVKTTITTAYSYIDTNIPFQSTISSTFTGSVVSRSNFLIRNLMSTKNDNSQAFNGVEQYDTWLDWTPYPYMFTRGATSSLPLGKFLTKRPRKEINVCYTDYLVLSELGKNNWGSTNTISTQYIVETWSVPPGPQSVIAIGAPGNMYINFSGNQTADWTPGSYVNITGWAFLGGLYFPIHTTTRILSNGMTGTNTIIYLMDADGTPAKWYNNSGTLIFTGYSSAMTIGGTHTWDALSTKKVIFNKLTPPIDRNEAPAGPKNLNLTEINNKTCYKYFVYHIKSTNNAWVTYDKHSETWAFNIDCACRKFKKYTLFWLNDLGGWDFYYFNLKSDIVREVERTQYHRHLKSNQPTAGFKYKQGDRGRTTFNTTSLDTITVRTEYLTQDELKWMANLLESPEVYWIDNTINSLGNPVDKIIPVNLKESSFDLWNKNNLNGDTGTLYIYEIAFESALNRGVQRGGTTALPSGTPTIVNPGTTPNGPWGPWKDYKPARDAWTGFTYTKSLYE